MSKDCCDKSAYLFLLLSHSLMFKFSAIMQATDGFENDVHVLYFSVFSFSTALNFFGASPFSQSALLKCLVVLPMVIVKYKDY